MSSGFVTESEIIESRKLRQLEWEKVRSADQPMEAPEEPYDGRSLFERLKEQKDKKESEYEEAHKLKNMIRGLDDDEIGFLDHVDQTKMNLERRQQIEEENELQEFRKRVANLQEKSLDDKIQAEIATSKPKVNSTNQKPSQKAILSGVVRKRKAENENGASEAKKKEAEEEKIPEKSEEKESPKKPVLLKQPSALKCIGILPGIGDQYNSSDSEDSSNSDEEQCAAAAASKYDLLGRNVACKSNHE